MLLCLGMLSYGEYDHGTGVDGEPMVFLGGSDVSCRHVRKHIFKEMHTQGCK